MQREVRQDCHWMLANHMLIFKPLTHRILRIHPHKDLSYPLHPQSLEQSLEYSTSHLTVSLPFFLRHPLLAQKEVFW